MVGLCMACIKAFFKISCLKVFCNACLQYHNLSVLLKFCLILILTLKFFFFTKPW